MRPSILILWLLLFLSLSVSANPKYLPGDRVCPAASEHIGYLRAPLFYDLNEVAKTERIPGLETHESLRVRYEKAEINLYYEFVGGFDPNKPTILFISGGPGQTHTTLHFLKENILDPYTDLSEHFNLLAMDHRGIGCSELRLPGGVPPESLYMRYAASDIELLRRTVLGENAELHIFAESYGTILAQTYALLYPAHLERLFLWGSLNTFLDFNRARVRYPYLLATVLGDRAEDLWLMQKRDPEYYNAFVRASVPYFYSYQGREIQLPTLFRAYFELVDQQDYEGAKDLIELPADQDGPLLRSWAARAIGCGEIFTHEPVFDGEFDLFGSFGICDEFAKHTDYFDYEGLIEQIEIPTFLYAGFFDHVTPIEAAVSMHDALPASVLYIDRHSGHAIDKPACFAQSVELFFSGASETELARLALSSACLRPPRL